MQRSSPLVRLVLLFVFISSFLIVFREFLGKKGIDSSVLLVANGLLFILSVITFYIQRRGLNTTNPHVFVRSVIGSMIIKMFLCIIILFVYFSVSGDAFNKKAVFVSLFLYLLYLVVEVSAVMKMNRKPHA